MRHLLSAVALSAAFAAGQADFAIGVEPPPDFAETAQFYCGLNEPEDPNLLDIRVAVPDSSGIPVVNAKMLETKSVTEERTDQTTIFTFRKYSACPLRESDCGVVDTITQPATVLVQRTLGDFACVEYGKAESRSRAGWIRLSSLEIALERPVQLEDWIGRWAGRGRRLEVRKAPEEAALNVFAETVTATGEMGQGGDVVCLEQAQGNGIKPVSDRIAVHVRSLCLVRFTREDNQQEAPHGLDTGECRIDFLFRKGVIVGLNQEGCWHDEPSLYGVYFKVPD